MKKVLAVMLVVIGGPLAMALAPPAIKVDDDAAGKDNRESLSVVAERLGLPAGKVAVDAAVAFQRENAGLVLTGNLTTVANVVPANDWVTGRAVVVRPGGTAGIACLSFYEPAETRPRVMPKNQVGWLFNADGSDGQGFYPAPVWRFKEGDEVPDSKLSFMRAWHGVQFTGVQTLRVPVGHGFKVGDDVFATDGPLINELVPEWRKVRSLFGLDTIVLNERLANTYVQGSLVGGPLPRRLSFQGLRFSGTWGPVLVQQSCDVKFTDCTFDQSQGWTSVIGCGRVQFVNCAMPSGFNSSTSHDVRFRNCTIREVVGEQAATDLRFDNCRFGPGTVDSKIHCVGWKLKECVSAGGLFVYDGWVVEDHVAYRPVVVRGRACVVRDLWSAQPVHVQGTYQGQPVGSGTGILLDGIVAPSIHCDPGTSGVIRRRSCPVTGDVSKWTITPKQ